MALLNKTSYVRVENIELGKNLMRFAVRYYEGIDKPPVKEETRNAPFAYTANPFEEAYTYLLTLPEFEGFIPDDGPAKIDTKSKRVAKRKESK